jgi:hypothetical protein
MVDVSRAGGAVAIGDEAVLIGRQGDEAIATAEVAGAIGSLYRVLATIPRGVPRVWRGP